MLYTKSGRSLWQITSPRWEPTSLTARRLGDSPSRTPPLSNFRHCSRPSWNNQEVQFLQKLAHIGCSCWRMKELEMFECLTIDYRTQSTFPTIIITLEVSTSVWQGRSMIGDYWLQQWIKICLTNCPKKCKWWHFDKKKSLSTEFVNFATWWPKYAKQTYYVMNMCKCARALIRIAKISFRASLFCTTTLGCPAMMSIWLLVFFLFWRWWWHLWRCWRCFHLLKMFLALSSAVSVGFTAPAPSMS